MYTQKITYTLRQGDSLSQLARYYGTTVPMILSLNPSLDPYRLKTGSVIAICPYNNASIKPHNIAAGMKLNCEKEIALINNMRLAWSQHIYWTRMLLISIAHKLDDQKATAEKLLANPKVTADIFAGYYPSDVAMAVQQLLNEHLQIGAELITALRDNKTAEAEALTKSWYINADKMAEAFSGINPYFDREHLRRMLYGHLELTTQEVAMRLKGKYTEDLYYCC